MSHLKKVLDHLKQGNSITSMEAIQRWKCTRLASRIKEIDNMGYDIDTEYIQNGKSRFAKYRLTQ